MSAEHIPVLFNEIIDSFSVFKNKSNLTYFDGTFGRGGHAKGILESYKITKIYATDQDLKAIEYAQINFPHIEFSHENFLDFAKKNIQNSNFLQS